MKTGTNVKESSDISITITRLFSVPSFSKLAYHQNISTQNLSTCNYKCFYAHIAICMQLTFFSAEASFVYHSKLHAGRIDERARRTMGTGKWRSEEALSFPRATVSFFIY